MFNFVSFQTRINDVDSIKFSIRWINQIFANHVENDSRNILLTQSLIESSSQCFFVEFQFSSSALSFVENFSKFARKKINYHRFFKNFDFLIIVRRQFHYSIVRIDTMYKTKIQKITLVNFNTSNEFMFDEQTKWKKIFKSNYDWKLWKKLIERFKKFLTFKFCIIVCETRLMSKKINKLIIESNLWFQKKIVIKKIMQARKNIILNFWWNR